MNRCREEFLNDTTVPQPSTAGGEDEDDNETSRKMHGSELVGWAVFLIFSFSSSSPPFHIFLFFHFKFMR